jgi:glycosyltransferase involved in cell wall biosynthesis
MQPEDVVIIVPVLDRPHRVAPLLDSIEGATRQARVLFVVNDSDHAERDAISQAGAEALVLPDRQVSYPAKVNAAYEATTEPWLFCAADDIDFHGGWLEAAAEHDRPDVSVIGTNDLGNGRVVAGEHSTHTFVRRSYADAPGATFDEAGTVLFEGYRHWFCDDELVFCAQQRGVWAHAGDSIVEHLHPYHGKAERDQTYALGEQRRRDDKRTFLRRQRKFLR